MVNDPLSPVSYAGRSSPQVWRAAQLLAGNGLEAISASATAGRDRGDRTGPGDIPVQQPAVSGLSALATQLGNASGNSVIEAVIAAVRSLAVAPAVAVFNLGSSTIGTVLATANAGFDLVLDGATSVVDPTVNALESTAISLAASPIDPAVAKSTVAADVPDQVVHAQHRGAGRRRCRRRDDRGRGGISESTPQRQTTRPPPPRATMTAPTTTPTPAVRWLPAYIHTGLARMTIPHNGTEHQTVQSKPTRPTISAVATTVPRPTTPLHRTSLPGATPRLGAGPRGTSNSITRSGSMGSYVAWVMPCMSTPSPGPVSPLPPRCLLVSRRRPATRTHLQRGADAATRTSRIPDLPGRRAGLPRWALRPPQRSHPSRPLRLLLPRPPFWSVCRARSRGHYPTRLLNNQRRCRLPFPKDERHIVAGFAAVSSLIQHVAGKSPGATRCLTDKSEIRPCDAVPHPAALRWLYSLVRSPA